MPLDYAVGFAVFWLIAFVIGQLAWMHATGNRRYSRVILCWFAISGAGYLVTFAIFNALVLHAPLLAWSAAAVSGAIIMACAFIVYMPFVFVVSSSLAVDTIIMLKGNGGAQRMEGVYARFISIDAVKRRLEMMQSNGLVNRENDRFSLTPKSIKVARFFTAMKHFWKLWPGG